MASTVTASTLTVTITESYDLNNVAYGNTNSKTFTSKGQVLQRIMNVSTATPQLLNFGAADAAGQVAVADYAYFRITNLDDTNFVNLQLFNGDDTFFYKLAAGDTFLLMNNEMYAVDGSTTFTSFADITRILGDADTAACDVEILAVTAQIMAKKRKLGSKNPKYKSESEKEDKYKKEFVHEVKGVKVYKLYLK